ncbi:hypothetical protein JCM10449v2_006138 [Rhodotorula kratochvilovae]
MTTQPATTPFDIVDIPGKGKGVVILADQPAFRTGAIRSGASVATAVSKLSSSDRLAFESLSITDSKARLGPHLGRVETNGLALGDGAREQGLFLVGARFNHSCVPNVCRTWDGPVGKELFVASVDIQPGTELEIYTALYEPKATRQQILRREFGFDCACAACSLPPDESAASDKRRKMISQINAMLPGLITEPDKLVTLAKESLKLFEQEGLYAGRASIAYDCFQAAVAWSDLDGAKAWASRNLELQALEAGVGSSEYKRIQSLQKKPKGHPSWGAFGFKKQVIRP